MAEAFQAAFRESIEFALIMAVVVGYLWARPASTWARSGGLVFALGALTGFAVGFGASYTQPVAVVLQPGQDWSGARYALEVAVFYLGLLFVMVHAPSMRAWSLAVLFLSGVALTLFDARSLGLFVRGVGEMKESAGGAAWMALLGVVLGIAPLALLAPLIGRLPLEKSLTLPGVLIFIGAFRMAFGGVGDADEGSVLAALEHGIQGFMVGAVGHMRQLLLFPAGEFVRVPLEGLAEFLSGDRAAMTLLVLFVVTPPVYFLIDLFSRPEPDVLGIGQAAERRLRLAFFQREIVFRSAPALAAFITILVALHAMTAVMNPLSEPVPIPVRESVEDPGVIRIALKDRIGDFSDRKLRKYVYYYGDRQVIFLTLLKPDGTVGLALDECEICKPADWNTKAQGYAQRGEDLVCKYCMTPVPASAVNKPGGCNPIPIPFRMGEGEVVVALEDLIRTYLEAKKLEGKGMHL